MRRRLPPLKTLPAFEIAAEQLSFTAAAGELNLTHGAVSRQIQALEAQLGVPLFRRRNRRIELSEAGLAFLPAVRQALQPDSFNCATRQACKLSGTAIPSADRS